MIVGAVGLLLDLIIFMPRRHSVTRTTTQSAAVDPYAGRPVAGGTVVQEQQTV